MTIRQQAPLSLAVLAAVLLAACSSTPLTTPAPTSTAPVSPAPVQSSQATSQPTAPSVVVAAPLAAYLDPANPLYKERSVYFDFDKYVVKPEADKLVEMHGRYLATHPEVSIKIEGNTDERGGSEYNLALGQKRAEAVQKALTVFGAKESQMEAVSFGKEKPKALGNNEAAYAQNRRADLAYPAK